MCSPSISFSLSFFLLLSLFLIFISYLYFLSLFLLMCSFFSFSVLFFSFLSLSLSLAHRRWESFQKLVEPASAIRALTSVSREDTKFDSIGSPTHSLAPVTFRQPRTKGTPPDTKTHSTHATTMENYVVVHTFITTPANCIQLHLNCHKLKYVFYFSFILPICHLILWFCW